ncbi:MAG TPA: hypothetical protein DD727_07860, partial [Clostridiales bacterium]|nr:hypothetical protein [Clostridiales bacterium]
MLRQDDTYVFEMFAGVDGFTNVMKKSIRDTQKTQEAVTRYASADQLVRDAFEKYNITLPWETAYYIVAQSSEDSLDILKSSVISILTNLLKDETTEENLSLKLQQAKTDMESMLPDGYLSETGHLIVSSLLKPGRVIDAGLTEIKKNEAYNKAYESSSQQLKILRGERILSVGDTVTESKLTLLRDLGMLDEGKGPDITYAGMLFIYIAVIFSLFLAYTRYKFQNNSINRLSLSVISTTLLITAVLSWTAGKMGIPAAIPVLMGAMITGIIYCGKFAFIINLMLAFSLCFIAGNEFKFMATAVISGTITGFIAEGVNQRGRLSMVGLLAGGINGLMYFLIGILQKEEFANMASEALIS